MDTSGSAVALSTDRLEVVLLELAEQCFALPLSAVSEITRACALQPLPHAPRVILGVLNLRGQMVPVIDARLQLGLPSTPLDPADHFIITRIARQLVALRVEQLLGLVKLEARLGSNTQTLPESLTFVSGVAAAPHGVVLIYDLEQFLSDSEAIELSGALGRLGTGDAVSA